MYGVSGARAAVAVQYAERNLHSLGGFLSSERNEVRDMHVRNKNRPATIHIAQSSISISIINKI